MVGVETLGGILVVEDDELVRSFLCSALAAARTVQGASDADSALRAAAVSPFALILVDCLLPDMHGTDLSRRLLLRPGSSSTAICIVSGTLRSIHPPLHGIAALPKPVGVRDLLAMTRELLDWAYRAQTHATPRAQRLDALSGLVEMTRVTVR